ncbi:hypothetical protein, partial [Vibrio parahaemolyticus]
MILLKVVVNNTLIFIHLHLVLLIENLSSINTDDKIAPIRLPIKQIKARLGLFFNSGTTAGSIT